MKYFLLLSAFFLFFSCQNVKKKTISLSSNNSEPLSFSKVFTKSKAITFTGLDSVNLPPNTSNFLIDNRGNFIFPNPFEKYILVFDSTGALMRTLGKEGRGPGEFGAIKRIRLDNEGKLWVYDPIQIRITVFDPNFDLVETYNLKERIGDFLIRNEFIIGYTPLAKNIIKKYNFDEQSLKESFKVKQSDKKIFLGRFQIKGLTEGFNDTTFYAMYPGEYKIKKYDYDLNILRTIGSKNKPSNKFRPIPPEFPSYLDPYEYNNEHEKWWVSFLHLYNLFTVGEDTFLVQLYSQTPDKEYTFYANIYDGSGKVITEGVKLPSEHRIIHTNKDNIYVTVPEKMQEDGSVKPLEVISYSLKRDL